MYFYPGSFLPYQGGMLINRAGGSLRLLKRPEGLFTWHLKVTYTAQNRSQLLKQVNILRALVFHSCYVLRKQRDVAHLYMVD